MEEADASTINSTQTKSDEKNFKELKAQIGKIKNSDLRKIFRMKADNFRNKIKNKGDEKIAKLKSKLKELEKKNEDPKYLIQKDKVTYSVVMTSFIFAFGSLFWPNTNTAFTFIITKICILLLHRFLTWKKKKWHYFLFDYGYVLNAFMFFCVKFGYSNKLLLATFFVNAFGPLTSGFLVFRHRIVWHDLKAYTSFFIHISPALVAWIMRFHVGKTRENSLPSAGEWEAWLENTSFWTIFKSGLVFYLAWAVGYYILVFVILDSRIKRKGNLTFFHYVKKSSFTFKKLSESLNKSGSVKIDQMLYMALHATASLLSLIYSSYLMGSKSLSSVVVIVLMILPICRTSTYYHEHFIKNYGVSIQKKAQDNKVKRIERERKLSAMSQQIKEE